MQRFILLGLTLAATMIPSAAASARVIEIGEVGTAAKPSCPTSPCEVISRTTAFQTRLGSERDMFVVPAKGRIVAWSITLGSPARKQLKYFQENLGGEAQAGIAVLKRGDRYYGRVLAASPAEKLTPYFGETVQFPLAESLPVEKGSVVALSVPTWAPALGLGLGRDSVWRASRAVDGCDDTETQSVQTETNDLARYKCFYRTARLAYSVTMITTPVPKVAPETETEEPPPVQPRERRRRPARAR